jgi:hypothetical protein
MASSFSFTQPLTAYITAKLSCPTQQLAPHPPPTPTDQRGPPLAHPAEHQHTSHHDRLQQIPHQPHMLPAGGCVLWGTGRRRIERVETQPLQHAARPRFARTAAGAGPGRHACSLCGSPALVRSASTHQHVLLHHTLPALLRSKAPKSSWRKLHPLEHPHAPKRSPLTVVSVAPASLPHPATSCTRTRRWPLQRR